MHVSYRLRMGSAVAEVVVEPRTPEREVGGSIPTSKYKKEINKMLIEFVSVWNEICNTGHTPLYLSLAEFYF